MRGIINLGEMLEIQMRVNLGRTDIGMTEHFLHSAQIATGLQHMRSKAVAQHVRMYVAIDALFYCPLFDAVLH